MGKRKVIIKQSVAQRVAEISWFIESQGMIATAENFTDSTYDFFEKLSDDRIIYPICREPQRASLGFKCVQFKKKYTVVLSENEGNIIIHEFIPSKLIRW